MVIEGFAAAAKEVAKEIAKEVAEKSLETAKDALEKKVQDLPDEIGELPELESLPDGELLEVELLPEIIGELSEGELFPDEIGEELEHENIQEDNDSNKESTQENEAENNNNDLKNEADKPNVEGENEVHESEKKGGSYGEVFKEGEGNKYEVHHMPADSASNLERNDGPAIKMEKEDHRQTASCGSSKEAREYRAAQKELIDQGKFREALQMDIDDIHEKFGDKYDDAIADMLDYVDKLESEGKING